MGDLANICFSLQEILNGIEANTNQARQHRLNANLANAGAALAYLLTRSSKNRTVRTVGGVTALGGILYGSHQRGQAVNLDGQNIQLIDSGLSVIELEGLSRLRAEPSPDVRRRFLELVPQLGEQVDDVIKRRGNEVKNKSLIGRKNQALLLQAGGINVIRNKLRLIWIYSQIDRKKIFPNYYGVFAGQVSTVDVVKLQKEGFYAKIIIGVSIVLGILLANIPPSAVILVGGGLGFWAINHFHPFFPETKKLKDAVNKLVSGLQTEPPIQTLRIT